MSRFSHVQHPSYVRPTRHLEGRFVEGQRCRLEHILDGSLQRQNVLDQAGDVFRDPGVMQLHGGLPGIEGRRRDQVAVIAVF